MTRLGRSGIEVFPLALGGNTFGWTSDEKAAFEVLDAFSADGGNFIDTADSYWAWGSGRGGESETIIGRWLRRRGRRDDIVVSTKVGEHPQFRGLAASNIARAADASLRRLDTDYIDVYHAHFDDPDTPLEETIGAFDGLLKSGKIRTVGVSNYSGDRIGEWFSIARRNNLAAPTVVEPHYNLVHRSAYESHIAPVASLENLAVVPYFGLASGFLTGKYKTLADLADTPRGQFAAPYLNEEGLAVVEALEAVADGHHVEPATIALAWLRGRPQVAAPLASARSKEQVPALIAAATLELNDEERWKLDQVSGRLTGPGWQPGVQP